MVRALVAAGRKHVASTDTRQVIYIRGRHRDELGAPSVDSQRSLSRASAPRFIITLDREDPLLESIGWSRDMHVMHVNSKVLAAVLGITIVAVVVFIVSPSQALSLLPFLLLLACPLMMIFMMGGMNHGEHADHGEHAGLARHSAARDDLAVLDGPPRTEQVRVLRERLADVTARQEVLARELERLDAGQVAVGEDGRTEDARDEPVS